jgi:hypothetical protein
MVHPARGDRPSDEAEPEIAESAAEATLEILGDVNEPGTEETDLVARDESAEERP